MEDQADLDPQAETPSDESVSEELSETPSDDLEAEASSDDVADEPADEDASPEEDQSEQEAPSTKAERRAWSELEKKYEFIKDPEERQEAVAKAYWEKARYAKAQRLLAEERARENERLKAELDLLKKPATEEQKEPPPHPDVAKVDQRIQALYVKNQTIQQEQQERLGEISKLDREVAIIEDRLKDAYDEQKPMLEERLRQAKRDYEYTRREYKSAVEKMADLNERMEQELANRDWIVKFNAQEQTRQQQQQRDLALQKQEYVKEVDSLIERKADELGLPKDDRIRKSVWKHVNRALMVDLSVMNAPNMDEVDTESMIEKFVKEFAEDREIVTRRTFKTKSDQKLAVAGRPGVSPSKGTVPSKPVPASMRPPVPPALLSSDQSPAMLRARKILVNKFGGGA